MFKNISIDLGTTNTVVATWNQKVAIPEIIQLESICRNETKFKELDDSYTIPSCVFLQHPKEIYSFPYSIFFNNLKRKTHGLIGMQAISADGGRYKPNFISSFKTYLGKNSYQFIGQLEKWRYTAEDITRIFLKSLFYELKDVKKAKLKTVTFCVPVDFYEMYRAKLYKIAKKSNFRKVKTIDEPVAAAIGYGLNIDQSRNLLVIDFGGGTLDFAVITTEEKTAKTGSCTVIAKDGMPIGGNIIDSWIVEDISNLFGYNFEGFSKDQNINWWYKILLSEACRVKESLYLKDAETFFLMPTKILAEYSQKILGPKVDVKKPIDYTKQQFIATLKKKGLYSIFNNLMQNVLNTALQKGISEENIDDVLLVGGSSLLPNIYSLVEKKFGRSRVRAWQPFNAVAFGAAAFSANMYNKTDYITHDYALITYNKESFKQEHSIIIPKGTVFPSEKNLWKKQLLPTCALGKPERIFKLIICEIGRKYKDDHDFTWDKDGNLHKLTDDPNDQLVIPLNEDDPTLGYLDPPHNPDENQPRIELSFFINEDKWLCATVFDLKIQKNLLYEKPIIRLK